MSYAGCRSHKRENKPRHAGRSFAAHGLLTRPGRALDNGPLPVVMSTPPRTAVNVSLPPAGSQPGLVAPAPGEQ